MTNITEADLIRYARIEAAIAANYDERDLKRNSLSICTLAASKAACRYRAHGCAVEYLADLMARANMNPLKPGKSLTKRRADAAIKVLVKAIIKSLR